MSLAQVTPPKSEAESKAIELTVVIPVRNDPTQLETCLAALSKTAFSRYEVVVVDDASTDDTVSVAKRFGARVVSLENQSGPARARNRGVEEAAGDIVFFIDADVCVAPQTIDKVVDTFRNDSTVAAVFGSYDGSPEKQNFISQYKNLLHHFVHQKGNRDASTFWSGCGAIRRSLFLKLNGFDTSFARPCIEDIELGARLRQAGHRIVLNPDIQVKHLKHWTLWGWIKTDVFDRAIPWTQLILKEKSLPNDLNLKMSQRLCGVLSCLLVVLFLVGAWFEPWLFLLPFVVLATTLAVDKWAHVGSAGRMISVVATLIALATLAAILMRFGYWVLLPASIVVFVVAVNSDLFVFFARAHNVLFAIATVPLHILYFIYSSCVFGGCLIWHRISNRSTTTASIIV